MKYLVALLLALGCVHIRGAPVEQGGIEDGSCADPFAVSAAGLALTKINQNRQEGYVLGLHRLSNVHTMKHGEIGVVFYLTLDVVETNCNVLSRKSWKNCETRLDYDTPVYGQCKAAIYISKVHRVVRLYKYSCHIRPVPSSRVWANCPDCLSPMNSDNAEVQKTVIRSLEKYNKEGGQANRFALLKVDRAMYGDGMMRFYSVEYTIQETTCPQTTEEPTAEKCPLMDCEFAHKGFCKASYVEVPEGDYEVNCELFEPEAAETQKRQHLLGGETDHSHNDTHGHNHDHDQAHDADQAHEHDHVHDHTKSHDQHDQTHVHADNSSHHHTHDHESGSSHSHAHPHSHDHGRDHDHVHSHHAKAHDHGTTGIEHHKYEHPDGEHTHEHDHELALDHDHKHGHLHEHEHHHHHHDHDHETSAHDEPKGMVILLPSMGKVMPMIPLPDMPVAGPEMGVTLPLKEDPQIPGEMEPAIEAYPNSLSAQCVALQPGVTLVEQLFAEDPMFKPAA